jgi:hypothetical protein
MILLDGKMYFCSRLVCDFRCRLGATLTIHNLEFCLNEEEITARDFRMAIGVTV